VKRYPNFTLITTFFISGPGALFSLVMLTSHYIISETKSRDKLSRQPCKTRVCRKKQNPYEHLIQKEYDDEKTEKYLKRASRYIDIALVPDHELYPSVAKYFDHVEVIRRAIDTSVIDPSYPNPENDIPIIAHAPSNRANKGQHLFWKP